MTHISRDDVLNLAQLSSLQLKEAEVAELTIDISNILAYVEKLGTLDTAGVEPTYQVTGLENVWRDDSVVTSVVSREQLLALSPSQHNNHVKVPKVL
jgi:aspartyl-tRNA(Asn)/glutamyl-tRNA(Gln) amidotransferase subunit C